MVNNRAREDQAAGKMDLHEAAERGDIESVAMMLQGDGVEVDALDDVRSSAFLSAIRYISS